MLNAGISNPSMVLNLSTMLFYYQVYGITIACDLPLDPWLCRSESQIVDLTITSRITIGEPFTPDASPLFINPLQDSLGRPISQLYYFGNILYFRMPSVGALFLSKDKIQIEISAGTDLTVVCAKLLSIILALWLELNNVRCIHTCCLVSGGETAAFMADSMTGKSTLLAAMLNAGAELLTDDILALVETPVGFLANPSYPVLRLSLKQAYRFLGKQDKSIQWYPALGKALVRVGTNGWGTYCDIPQRIQHMYILNRCPNLSESDIHFENLSEVDSILALVRYSFIIHTPLVLGTASERLAFFARVVKQVRVTRLTFPSGYKYLSKVSHLIRDDMEKNSAT